MHAYTHVYKFIIKRLHCVQGLLGRFGLSKTLYSYQFVVDIGLLVVMCSLMQSYHVHVCQRSQFEVCLQNIILAISQKQNTRNHEILFSYQDLIHSKKSFMIFKITSKMFILIRTYMQKPACRKTGNTCKLHAINFQGAQLNTYTVICYIHWLCGTVNNSNLK